MLKGLFGNQTVGKILIFLFVNEKCYASQIQTFLQLPLTPIQKALLRLEKGGFIQSCWEGKIKLYQFNLDHPLHTELEALIKKSYLFLSNEEKKEYRFIPKARSGLFQEKIQTNPLLLFWQQLKKVQQLTLYTKAKEIHTPCFKIGKAEVTVSVSSSFNILFQEKGYWFLEGRPYVKFTNTFSWTLDIQASSITLEHLRYGCKHPVFLFCFVSRGTNLLESVDAHLCNKDTYLGHIDWDKKRTLLHCRVIGPHKNNETIYYYS